MPFDMKHRKFKKPRAGTVPRRATIVLAIVEIIHEDWREGITPTMLNHEALIWAALRSGLCLGGMGWHEAHKAAGEIVHEAFARAGAKRPAWKEGQPEATDGGILRNRTQCANCSKGLDVDQRVYCGKLCHDAHRARMARNEDVDRFRAIERLRKRRRNDAA